MVMIVSRGVAQHSLADSLDFGGLRPLLDRAVQTACNGADDVDSAGSE
ncbi:hypothetical protein Agau_C201668 [Agrobacterium tumefaciens F2]|nr:hypothetical protein Agau_C201668 [Agrobacterium tumefaciens F2]